MLRNASKTIAHVRACLAGVALVSALVCVGAAGADTFILKNGTKIEGEIVRETSALVWVKTSEGKMVTITRSDIDYHEAGPAGGTDPESAPESGTPETDDGPEITDDEQPGPDAVGDTTDLNTLVGADDGAYELRTGVTRAAIITLGEGGDKDMVGIYMTAHILKEMIPMLEADGVEVVVFRVNSGGGLLLEIQRLSDVIHDEYKPRFRVAAWIESAISAAAMTSHAIEEIYFTPEGNYGACTGWSGALVAVEGRDLEEVIYEMEKISARGGHDPAIMRAMQHMKYPLSCTIDPTTGKVKWYNTDEGGIVLNEVGKILTFDSEQAAKYRFSKGTARTLDELAKLMGYNEIQWVGKVEKTFAWPISKAERANMRYRDRVYDDQVRFGEYVLKYQGAANMASGQQDRKLRGALVGKARQGLNQIIKMVENNPNFALLNLNIIPEQWDDWKRDRLQELRDLMR